MNQPQINIGNYEGYHNSQPREANLRRLEKMQAVQEKASNGRRGWRNAYKNQDIEALKEKAKSYFTPSKRGGGNMLYIGPEGEYQKWYALINRDKKREYRNKWYRDNLKHSRAFSEKNGRETRFRNKVDAFRKISGCEVPQCCVCSTKDIRVLTINHINGKGRDDQILLKEFGKIYLAILNGIRQVNDLEIRCYNCNILYEYERGKRKLPDNWMEIINEKII